MTPPTKANTPEGKYKKVFRQDPDNPNGIITDNGEQINLDPDDPQPPVAEEIEPTTTNSQSISNKLVVDWEEETKKILQAPGLDVDNDETAVQLYSNLITFISTHKALWEKEAVEKERERCKGIVEKLEKVSAPRSGEVVDSKQLASILVWRSNVDKAITAIEKGE